jgi:23S rRNA pseudouridine1911/1915/1917 synthase
MVIARNQKTFLELKNKFQNREIEKKYWAVVYGKPKDKIGVINKPLARATTYKKQVIAGKKTETKIREAVTQYKVLKNWDNLSLLEVTPKTGRMHQIRVHLTSIGHPIAGDKLYKTNKTNKTDGMENMAVRQMLHAKSIKFNLFEADFLFEVKVPADFDQFLTKSR